MSLESFGLVSVHLLLISASHIHNILASTRRLLRGPYLVVASESQVVANLEGSDVHLITSCSVIPFSVMPIEQELQGQFLEDERRYLSLLNDFIGSCMLHFSYTHDLTLSTQQLAILRSNSAQSTTLSRQCDHRFMFNFALAQPMLQLVEPSAPISFAPNMPPQPSAPIADANSGIADDFVLCAVNGYFFSQLVQHKVCAFPCVSHKLIITPPP